MTRLTKTEDTTTITGYTIVKWVCTDPSITGTDTWITPVGVSNVEYLVVASVGEYETSGFSDA